VTQVCNCVITTPQQAFRSVYALTAHLRVSQAKASRLGKRLGCGTRLRSFYHDVAISNATSR